METEESKESMPKHETWLDLSGVLENAYIQPYTLGITVQPVEKPDTDFYSDICPWLIYGDLLVSQLARIIHFV